MKLSPPASSSDLEVAREIARRLHQRRRREDRPGRPCGRRRRPRRRATAGAPPRACPSRRRPPSTAVPHAPPAARPVAPPSRPTPRSPVAPAVEMGRRAGPALVGLDAPVDLPATRRPRQHGARGRPRRPHRADTDAPAPWRPQPMPELAEERPRDPGPETFDEADAYGGRPAGIAVRRGRRLRDPGRRPEIATSDLEPRDLEADEPGSRPRTSSRPSSEGPGRGARRGEELFDDRPRPVVGRRRREAAWRSRTRAVPCSRTRPASWWRRAATGPTPAPRRSPRAWSR